MSFSRYLFSTGKPDFIRKKFAWPNIAVLLYTPVHLPDKSREFAIDNTGIDKKPYATGCNDGPVEN